MAQVVSEISLEFLLILAAFYTPIGVPYAELSVHENEKVEMVLFVKRTPDGADIYRTKAFKKKLFELTRNKQFWSIKIFRKKKSLKERNWPELKEGKSTEVKVGNHGIHLLKKGSLIYIEPKTGEKWIKLKIPKA